VDKRIIEPKCSVLTEEKFDEVSIRLEHSPQKSFRCFTRGTEISKLSAQRELYSISQAELQCMNLNFLWRC
jgi:hypothetical protein